MSLCMLYLEDRILKQSNNPLSGASGAVILTILVPISLESFVLRSNLRAVMVPPMCIHNARALVQSTKFARRYSCPTLELLLCTTLSASWHHRIACGM